MPDADASAGLSETARVALPIRVRCSHSPVSTITMIATMLLISARGVIAIGPTSMPAWPWYCA